MKLEDIMLASAAFAEESPVNYVPDLGNMRIFDSPLVGVAAATDQLFSRLKEESAVGARHMSPGEWLPGAQSVVVFFLPFTRAVREANRGAGLPATEWLYGRIEGEAFSVELRKLLAGFLSGDGYSALAPSDDRRFAIINRRSNWSERHVAFIAGLGTLSLNCSIITARGAAGRVGSVVTSRFLAPTPRFYISEQEYCSRCGACIGRCPVGAIDEQGKSHQQCSDYLDMTRARFSPRYGCGKCQTGVPCEEGIPGR